MANFKYAIAALFFAASVACLALWWRSYHHVDLTVCSFEIAAGVTPAVKSDKGVLTFGRFLPHRALADSWYLISIPASDDPTLAFVQRPPEKRFGTQYNRFYCPHWYPALVFALAGIGALRFRRQFSIRSALIGLAVVAALLGMVVAL